MSGQDYQNGQNQNGDQNPNSNDNQDDPEIEIEEEPNRQYFYILPSDIIEIWQKCEEKLKGIRDKRYNLEEIVQQITSMINFHFTYQKKLNLQNLIDYLDELTMKQKQYYQNELIPFMAGLALDVKQIFQQNDKINLLYAGEQLQQIFTKYQIAVLICNMFFCTLHEQIDTENYPKIFDFSRLYQKGTIDEFNILKKEKLKFFFNYFSMIHQDKINTNLCVSFERVNFNYAKDTITRHIIESKVTRLSEVVVYDDKFIEQGQNLIQATFANKFIGGGVLNKGSLQEEIRYLISPECIVGILLFSELQKNEAIVICGAQQVSDYTGYGTKIKFKGEYNDDKVPIQESNNMLDIVIVGMDAYNFNQMSEHDDLDQHSIKGIMREVSKAYTAFCTSPNAIESNSKKGVITGNWGCGDFGGDKELKFFIQWIAASWAEKSPLYYCTYGDQFLKTKIEEIYYLLKRSDYELQTLINIIKTYPVQRRKNPELSLFDYITLQIP